MSKPARVTSAPWKKKRTTDERLKAVAAHALPSLSSRIDQILKDARKLTTEPMPEPNTLRMWIFRHTNALRVSFPERDINFCLRKATTEILEFHGMQTNPVNLTKLYDLYEQASLAS